MNIINLIKKVAVEAVEASHPCNVIFGKIVSVSPLQINVNQKLPLTSEFLILTRTMQNCQIGENVVLLREQGGQKYIVLDRL